MTKIGLLLFVAATILISGCTGSKPLSELEASDEEAIYNVMFVDNYRLSVLDLITSDVPDTAAFIDNPDTDNPLYWHVIEATDEDLLIDISDSPVEGPHGPVFSASVVYNKTYTGTFEILRYNADADSLERYSKVFSLRGTRNAVCQQWGVPNQVRRGWILTSVGDARFFTPGASYHFLDELFYSTPSDSGLAFDFGNYRPEELMNFEPDEEMTIRYRLIDSADLLLIYVPSDDFAYRLAMPQVEPGGWFNVVFDMPSRRIYGQLRFLVINAGMPDDDYAASGFCYNYSTR